MLTLQDIANLFGGSIPTWFWVVAVIVVIVLLVAFGGASSASSYGKGDIRVGRNSDGSYYAYDKESGAVLFTASTKQDVANWVASQVR